MNPDIKLVDLEITPLLMTKSCNYDSTTSIKLSKVFPISELDKILCDNKSDVVLILKNKNLLKYFDGIHFPSTKLDEIKKYDTLTIASTHNISEVKKAKTANFITFSPIFDSKGRTGLGIEKLNEIAKLHPNVLALGGIISEKEVEIIKNSKAKGFASIRYFFT